jgi:hypothetical protein
MPDKWTFTVLININFWSSGFADTIQGLQLLGLMDPNPHPALHPKGPDITCVSSAEYVQFHRNDVMGRVQNWLIAISWLLLTSLFLYPRTVVCWCFCPDYHIQLCSNRNMPWGNKKYLSEHTEHIVLSSVARWCMQLPLQFLE